MEEINKKVKGKRGRPRVYNYLEQFAIPVVKPVPEPEQIVEPIIISINAIKYCSQYYQDHKNIKVTCPKCLQEVQKYTIGKHQKNKTCILINSLNHANK
jgi:hypothetical protein